MTGPEQTATPGRERQAQRVQVALLFASASVLGAVTVLVAAQSFVGPSASSAVAAVVVAMAVMMGVAGYFLATRLGSRGVHLAGMGEVSSYTRGLEAAVNERTAELEAANKELQRLATTDGLTGLLNHRAFQEVLAFELLRAQRHPRSLVLCMLDIDHFKTFNDGLGHPAGDEVLRSVAKLLEERLRAIDIVARYGGEEFAIILLDSSAEDGLRTANKIRDVFRDRPFPGEENQPSGKLTVSVGVAAYPEHAQTQPELIEMADIALYEAKRRGRDQAVCYQPGIPPRTRTGDLDGRSRRRADLTPGPEGPGSASASPEPPDEGDGRD